MPIGVVHLIVKEDIIFFRNIYINSPLARNIQPEWFYLMVPVDKLKEQMDAFLMHTYNQIFSNPASEYKLKKDFEKYYEAFDKTKYFM